ncbi:Alpha/Beta hydrolase protein [Delphinella strobiligena]|nr:Alpha/Beta hydrolase protein [Delphinella strobiligena]
MSTNGLPNRAVLGLAASLALASCFYLSKSHNSGDKIIESPLSQVLALTQTEQERLSFPPDVVPGARDMSTPYGSIRVHEWGPEDGRRMLLVHGISTPGIALYSVADELVKNGCRVMFHDLWGRGFSDTPDPAKYPQDVKLFTTQILIVLASSPLSWTGPQGFTLIGYSLGGGIAATFTSLYPGLVESLILVAPAGLMRPARIHWTSRLIYGGFLPSWLVSWLPLFPGRSSVSVADAVNWQLHSHAGFLPAFISSIQHAPISNQHAHWRKIGSKLATQRESRSAENQRLGLREGKVLLILGKTDDVVFSGDVSQDAKEVLGEDSVDIKFLEGGHDLPVVAAHAITETILAFWEAA